MTEPLTDSELEYLLNFIGYGRIDADVWFMGMEEAGGGEENIRARLKFQPIMDNAEAHMMLDVTHLPGEGGRSSEPGGACATSCLDWKGKSQRGKTFAATRRRKSAETAATPC